MFNLKIFIILMIFIKFMIMMVPVLISVAYLTLLESKILGLSQLSKGPNLTGIFGIFQPLSDGLKLFSKETLIPSHVSLLIYIFSPLISLILNLTMWINLPVGYQSLIFDVNQNFFLILAMSSLGIYVILMSGWGSNSKYSFMGSMSATSQMISYEVSFGLIMLTLLMLVSSFNFKNYLLNQNLLEMLMFPLLISGFFLLISLVAESNSAPFDLTEGESELVSGFNVEYSSMNFALFFLSEYSHMIFSGFLFNLMFLSKYINIGYMFKSLLLVSLMILMSTAFPSFSYDHLMYLMWKNFLPLILILIIMFSIMLLM